MLRGNVYVSFPHGVSGNPGVRDVGRFLFGACRNDRDEGSP